MRPRFASSLTLLESRGRRESRVRAATAVSRAKCNIEDAHEDTGSAEAIPAFPAGWFTAFFALSPVTGLFCHRRRRNHFHQLDTSVGVSGPHDFAVRLSAVRQ